MPSKRRSIRNLRLPSLCALTSLFALAVYAANLQAGLNEWTGIDPYGGASLKAMAFDPANGNTIYGSDVEGLRKSVDGGANWAKLSVRGVSFIKIDPQNPRTIYAGLNKSVDGGQTWTGIATGVSAPGWVTTVYDLAIDPHNPSVLYLASWGAGIFKSINGGESWTPTNAGLPTPYFRTLAIDPQSSSTIYAGAGHTEPGPKMFKSTDGEATWVDASNGLPSGGALHTMVIDPMNPNTLYVSAGANGVFKSNNGGANWTLTGTVRKPNTAYGLVVSPSQPNIVYTIGDGVWKSTDGATTWVQTVSDFAGDFLAIHPHTANTVYALTYDVRPNSDIASRGNVLKTSDGGITWSNVFLRVLSGFVSSLAIDPRQSGNVIAAVSSALVKTTDDGGTWSPSLVASPGIFTGGPIVFDASFPSIAYAVGGIRGESSGVGFIRSAVLRSNDGGANWTVQDPGTSFDARIMSLATDPRIPAIVYAGGFNNGRFPTIFKSSDGGTTWHDSSSGLPRPEFLRETVVALAVDPRDSSRVYAATTTLDGRSGLYRSENGGANWSSLIKLDDLITGLAIDLAHPDTMYAGADHFYELDPDSEYLARLSMIQKIALRDGSWKILNSSCCIAASALVVDPQSPDTVYAGGYSGAYRSIDGGTTWSSMNRGFTSVSINVLALDPNNSSKLYAGTGTGVATFTFSPPQLFSVSGDGRGQGAILHANSAVLAAASNPAQGGEILEIYCTGLDASGGVAPQVTIGGRTTEVLYFGNPPSLGGENQVNVRVPNGVSAGPAIAVRMSYLGRTSNEVTIAVQ